jgi:hypothetical protein
LRLTHYWVVYGPSSLLLKLHAPAAAALLLAHVIWNGAPLASLWACWLLSGRSDLSRLAAPAAYFAAIGLMSWGFPTEAMLLAVFAWPAYFAVVYGGGLVARIAGVIAMVGCTLSYDVGFLFLPVFGLAALTNANRRSAVTTAAIGSVAAIALAGLALAVLAPFRDPTIEQHAKFDEFFAFGAMFQYPMLQKEAWISALVGACFALDLVAPGRLKAIYWILGLMALAFAIVSLDGSHAGRYSVRTILVLGLWGGMLGLIFLRRVPQIASRLMRSSPILCSWVAILLIAVTVENIHFGSAWAAYDRSVAVAANCRPVRCVASQVAPFKPPPDVGEAVWTWGMPFRSWLRADDPSRMTVLLDRDGRLSNFPLNCHNIGLLPRGSAAPSYAALAEMACPAHSHM